MKITSRGRYAVLAMVDIAKHGDLSPCSLAHISIRQNISLSYLEQIFNDLKKAELVRSQRGPGGGYKLSKNSSDIRILEIFDAIDEKIKTTSCGNNPKAFCSGNGKKFSQLKSLLNFWAISLDNSKCCFWSAPTGTCVALYSKISAAIRFG